MLGFIMQFDISVRLTPQITTIICYHVKKYYLKKEIKIWKNYTKIHMLTKTKSNKLVRMNIFFVYLLWRANERVCNFGRMRISC